MTQFNNVVLFLVNALFLSSVPVQAQANDRSGLRYSDMYGTSLKGQEFDDKSQIAGGQVQASYLKLRGHDRLEGIELTLSSGQIFKHGDNTAEESTLFIGSDEYLNHVRICKDANGGISWLKMTTSKGNSCDTGYATKECVDYWAASGWSIVGFQGRADSQIQRLAVIYGQNPVK